MDHFLVGEGVDLWPSVISVKVGPNLVGGDMEDLHLSDGSKFSHSKYIVCDREEIALGTGNWLVEDVELHPQLYVWLKDKPLARELVAHLREQIAAHGASSLPSRP